uniref:Uncharacterized protein n=1 Tax=Siphoviridae sp. ctNwR4 TaxID=2825474 RepID=A0A8S5P2X4_9CAUD|nr:MAG TPA: hypothetical protein [Siphoviridae sp. ctNwR4]
MLPNPPQSYPDHIPPAPAGGPPTEAHASDEHPKYRRVSADAIFEKSRFFLKCYHLAVF